ncbi:hypothetical protein BH23PLA1_BH23PLA1_29270 [soil metagenome]
MVSEKLRGMKDHLRYPLTIALFGLIFFADLVLHPAHVLYSDYSDLLAYHLPLTHFLVASYHQTGEVPLWCPYNFAGMPLIHDIQVAASYPLHLPLYVLPEAWVGPTLSWLVVVHVLIAGWGMYAYARCQGLGDIGAIVAALGFMFAGKWMLHLLGAGQYMNIGLAWLPLVLLGLERAIRRSSLLSATWAGVAYALLILGTHPQLTFYAGLFIALWTLAPALERAGYLEGEGPHSWQRTAGALARWIGFGAWTVLVAAALAAVQLLPTLEAAPYSTRGVVGMIDRSALAGGVSPLLIGPSPTGLVSGYGWEIRSGLGLLWLTAALLASVLRSGRVQFQTVVLMALIVFGMGGAVVFQRLPGFRLFQIPVRMFLIASLPVALLAGVATQALFFNGPGPSPTVRRRCLRILLLVMVIAAASERVIVRQIGIENVRFQAYWAALLLTVPAAFWLLGWAPEAASGTDRQGIRSGRGLIWCAILLVDLWALAWPLVAVRPEAEIYAPSRCVQYLIEHNEGHGRVLARDVADLDWGTPAGAGMPILHRIEQVRGYNPLDVYRYKEYAQFISNVDETPMPAHGIGNIPIRNKSLLDLLGVRYLLQPSDLRLSLGGEDVVDDPRWRKVFEDPHPRAYLFVAGGIQDLPPYTVYENQEVFPRAFVVPEAAPLPERSRVLQALKTTDFRRRVLLEGEGFEPRTESPDKEFRPATIRVYQPNRVIINVDGNGPGYLVLADLWYPGWTCTVDGRPARLHRANFLFRAVAVPPGRHEVTFEFAPRSYFKGRIISREALAVVVGLSLIALCLQLPRSGLVFRIR